MNHEVESFHQGESPLSVMKVIYMKMIFLKYTVLLKANEHKIFYFHPFSTRNNCKTKLMKNRIKNQSGKTNEVLRYRLVLRYRNQISILNIKRI